MARFFRLEREFAVPTLKMYSEIPSVSMEEEDAPADIVHLFPAQSI